jgi:hypothetical protein
MQGMSTRQRSGSAPTSTRVKLAPKHGASSKSSAFDPSQLDPKRAKRILANRQSAARSRMKRLQLMHDLDLQVEGLKQQQEQLQTELQREQQRQEQLRGKCLATERQLRAQQQELAWQHELKQSWQKEIARLRAAVAQQGASSGQMPGVWQAQQQVQGTWQLPLPQALQQQGVMQQAASQQQVASSQQQAQQCLQLPRQQAAPAPAALPMQMQMHIDSNSVVQSQGAQPHRHARQLAWQQPATSLPSSSGQAQQQQQQQQQQALARWPAGSQMPDHSFDVHPASSSEHTPEGHLGRQPLPPPVPMPAQHQHLQHQHLAEHQRASSDPLGFPNPSSSSSPSRPSSIAAASPTGTVEVHSDLSDEKDLLSRQLGLKASPLIFGSSPEPELPLMDVDLLLGDSPLFSL